MMSIIGQTYFDKHGTVAGNAIRGAEQCEIKQSHIFYAMQRIENQVEQCGGKLDSLLHRLRVVSRDPKLEDNQAMPKREGYSELSQRLNGIMNGLEELDRRIAMQLDMLEI
jgi:tetrahydromethanopterin S-methyltransferase subunit B